MLLFLPNNEQLIYIGSIELLLNISGKGGRKSLKRNQFRFWMRYQCGRCILILLCPF